MRSLAAQGFDGMEPRRPPGGIKRRQKRQGQCQHHDGGGFSQIHFGRQAREEIQVRSNNSVLVSQDRNWRSFSILAQNTVPTTNPVMVPMTPIAVPVMRNMRITAPWETPMVRRIAMFRVLSLTSMVRAERMLSAATSTIKFRIMNITLRST